MELLFHSDGCLEKPSCNLLEEEKEGIRAVNPPNPWAMAELAI